MNGTAFDTTPPRRSASPRAATDHAGKDDADGKVVEIEVAERVEL